MSDLLCAAGRRGRPATAGWLLVGAMMLALGPSPVRAVETEVRQFTIQVDGKPAGNYQMTIHRQIDGTVSLTAQSDVRVTILAIPVYTYSYSGQEVWKDGRLLRLESSGSEKGKPFSVSALSQNNVLVVTANGQQHTTRPDVWTTSCWQLPGAAFRNQDVPLLGCDNGTDIPGHLQYVGAEQLTVAGQAQTCAHYRVMKTEPHDLWYDAQERLVREEWDSGSHHTVLEMTQIQR
jgi:hypothetical protein